MSYTVLGRMAFPHPMPVTLSQFHALSYLLPTLAQPELHSDKLHVAFLSEQDRHMAQLILSAMTSERMARLFAEQRARKTRRQKGV